MESAFGIDHGEIDKGIGEHPSAWPDYKPRVLSRASS